MEGGSGHEADSSRPIDEPVKLVKEYSNANVPAGIPAQAFGASPSAAPSAGSLRHWPTAPSLASPTTSGVATSTMARLTSPSGS